MDVVAFGDRHALSISSVLGAEPNGNASFRWRGLLLNCYTRDKRETAICQFNSVDGYLVIRMAYNWPNHFIWQFLVCSFARNTLQRSVWFETHPKLKYVNFVRYALFCVRFIWYVLSHIGEIQLHIIKKTPNTQKSTSRQKWMTCLMNARKTRK